MILTKGLARADLISAEQAIAYYEEKGYKDIKNIAAYHLQQAAEKLIKIQIYSQLSNVDYRKMYTHDLSRLVGYAQSEGLILTVPEYIKAHMNSITDWEAGSRYDVCFSVRIDVLKRTRDVIAEWINQIS